MQGNVIIDPIPLDPTPAPRNAPKRARLRERPETPEATSGRRPDWLRVKLSQNENYWELKKLMRGQTLHTVCEEAFCPNLGECWIQDQTYLYILSSLCSEKTI